MSDEDEFAKKVADRLMERIYTEIGRSIFKKIMWVGLGILIAVGVSMGIIKFP